VLTADIYTSVLPAAQYKAAEATAPLVLDAARIDRHKIVTVARGIRMAARKYQMVSPPTSTGAWDQCRSLAVSRTPEAITGRGNHEATTWQRPSTQDSMNSYICC
jgi:hypothetical protein